MSAFTNLIETSPVMILPVSGLFQFFEIGGDIDTFTDGIWSSLNSDNKVSLFVRYISKKDGSEQTRIVNKNV